MSDLNPDAKKYNLNNFPEMKYKPLSEPFLNACLINVRQSTKIKAIAKKIAVKFKLSGVCDVAYVSNIIGDNMPNYEVIADRLVSSYGIMVERAGYTESKAKNYIISLLESGKKVK